MVQHLMMSGKILNKILFKALFVFFLISIVIFYVVDANSIEKLEAEKFVINTTAKAKIIALNKDISTDKKKQAIQKLALESVDVDGLGRYCLGSNINSLNDKEKKIYVSKFREFFSKNITNRLQNYSDEDIQIIGSEKRSKNYVLVKSKIISKLDKQEINIDWRVFLVNDKLLIRDLVVEGISLAKAQREEFSSIFASSGFKGLIDNLNNFINNN